MNRTKIAWVRNPDGSPGFTWNPAIGCSHESPGCQNCYAARLASTRLAHLPQYAGLARDGHWTGNVRLLPVQDVG
jgi:protein gp37